MAVDITGHIIRTLDVDVCCALSCVSKFYAVNTFECKTHLYLLDDYSPKFIKRLLSRNLKSLTSIIVPNIDTACLLLISRHTSLKDIEIHTSAIGQLSLLNALPNLERLCIEEGFIDGPHLPNFPQFKNLRELTLGVGTECIHPALRVPLMNSILRCRNLEQLHFPFVAPLTFLNDLRQLPKLRKLEIIVEDKGVGEPLDVIGLGNFPSLVMLGICYNTSGHYGPSRYLIIDSVPCDTIQKMSLAQCEMNFSLEPCTSLYQLALTNPKSVNWEELQNHPTLTNLEFSRFNGIPWNECNSIYKMSRLTHLVMSSVATLKGISGLSQLGLLQVDISDCDVETQKAGFQEIFKLQALKTLAIIGTSLTDDCISQLSKLTNLEELELLVSTNVNDNLFESLSHLKNLKLLVMEDWKINKDLTTEGVIASLQGAKNLKELRFTGFKKIDKEELLKGLGLQRMNVIVNCTELGFGDNFSVM